MLTADASAEGPIEVGFVSVGFEVGFVSVGFEVGFVSETVVGFTSSAELLKLE